MITQQRSVTAEHYNEAIEMMSTGFIDYRDWATDICIAGCSVSRVWNLYEGMQYLDVDKNVIEELSELPSTLKQLFCNWNMLEELPKLPDSLEYVFGVGNNFSDEYKTYMEMKDPKVRFIL